MIITVHVCAAGLCLNPDQLRNGIVSVASRLVGENAMYACHDGYRLSGDSTRRCQISRTWSGHLPECIRKFNEHACVYILKHRVLCPSFVNFGF